MEVEWDSRNKQLRLRAVTSKDRKMFKKIRQAIWDMRGAGDDGCLTVFNYAKGGEVMDFVPSEKKTPRK